MTRYLRVGKNPRRVLPPVTIIGPTDPQPSQQIDATGGAESTNTTNHTIQVPTAVSGDLLILVFYCDPGSSPSSTPTGWTADANNDFSSMYVYTKVADGTETSFTLTTGGSVESAHICWSIRGSSTYEVSGPATGGGNGSLPNPPSISPAAAPGTYLVYAVAGASGINDAGNWPGNATPPSGYTLIDQGRGASSGGDEKLWIGYAVVDITTAEDPGTMYPPTSTGQSWRSITIAVPYGDPTVATADHTHTVGDATDTTISSAAKGDLLVHNGSVWVNLPVGANGQVLTVDSSTDVGVKWVALLDVLAATTPASVSTAISLPTPTISIT